MGPKGDASYLLLGEVLQTPFPPFGDALYLVLAPLVLLALVAGQGAGGTLDLPLDHVHRPFDFVSPSRSEEHTSELQSRQYLVCRLLLEKKKKTRRLCVY